MDKQKDIAEVIEALEELTEGIEVYGYDKEQIDSAVELLSEYSKLIGGK